MENIKSDKIKRILGIYTKLIHGHVVNKVEEAQNYHVNERSIQRDIDDIRGYFEDSVTNENQKLVRNLIGNEVFHYVEPRHHSHFIDTLWELGQAIRNCQYIKIDYTRTKDKKTVTRKLKPTAIMFSEYYFYLTAFIDEADEARQNFDVLNDSFPTIYRIDRIQKLQVQKEKFRIPYSSRFEEGEFRKRIQFMYGGKLEKVIFRYKGNDIDSVLDRLQRAQILNEEDGVYTIRAEVFGKGIEMWLRSQGENVEVV